MTVRNLYFFDSEGYNLNFEWDRRTGCWEGNIYLPKVSVGLYANASIYVLEKVDGKFVFPEKSGDGKLKFHWDSLNKFVDEFFMFDFSDTWNESDSPLTFVPNDGPDCRTVLINQFDEYEISLDDMMSDRALPIHVAFMANEKYDSTTYNRTLVMEHDGNVIARIKFFAETVEDDERLKIWNSNLGYGIDPEDVVIFNRSDIKEYRPDYVLLNEKRKELMMEGDKIYPYVGSYAAIVNAIKFFGYDNLNIIEYWKNINVDDVNFGRIYHSSKYSLTEKEFLNVGARNIVLPNKDYRKINKISLVYTMNQPEMGIDGFMKVDEYELPVIEEKFIYTLEEHLVKLFALRKKLNSEFMPGSSKIRDIICEGRYFGKIGIGMSGMEVSNVISSSSKRYDFEVVYGDHVYLTDDALFLDYIKYLNGDDSENVSVLDDSSAGTGVSGSSDSSDSSESSESEWPVTPGDDSPFDAYENAELCRYYREFYDETYVKHTFPFDDIDNPETVSASAKILVKSSLVDGMTFDDMDICFGFDGSQWMNQSIEVESEGSEPPDVKYEYVVKKWESDLTFEGIDDRLRSSISWIVQMSDNQYDDDMKKIGKVFEYERDDNSLIIGNKSVDEYGEFFIHLKRSGYYDVSMFVGDSIVKTYRKCIKVELKHPEIYGFYYDVRPLPERLSYDVSDDMNRYVKDAVSVLIEKARKERANGIAKPDMDFPVVENDVISRTGPYYYGNINGEWCELDNLSYEISNLETYEKYVRYIRNGVDIKPYTWFLLTFDYGLRGCTDPVWTIVHNEKDKVEYHGEYLTCMLKEEGEYMINLTFSDINGNSYEVSRNLFVVDSYADYKLYQSFRKEYDVMNEISAAKDAKQFETFLLDANPFVN